MIVPDEILCYNGVRIGFFLLTRKPRYWTRKIEVSRTNSSSYWDASVRNILTRYIIILTQSLLNRKMGIFIIFVDVYGAKDRSWNIDKRIHATGRSTKIWDISEIFALKGLRNTDPSGLFCTSDSLATTFFLKEIKLAF